MGRSRREHYDDDSEAGREWRRWRRYGRAGAADEELARQLAEQARAEGVSLTGPGGLLGRLTKVVLESALEGEMDAHLGYAQARSGRVPAAGTPATGTGPRRC